MSEHVAEVFRHIYDRNPDPERLFDLTRLAVIHKFGVREWDNPEGVDGLAKMFAAESAAALGWGLCRRPDRGLRCRWLPHHE